MKQIKTDELDFDLIVSNIKTFLRGQSEFTDYDFEGSVMSTLISILAYNTHYNLLYTNLALNESFIDSASKRSSVVSIAKSLGYTAQSIRSARAKLNIVVSFPADNLSVIQTMPKSTIFASVASDIPLQFQTAGDVSTPKIGGVFTFPDVEIIQGTGNTTSYIVTPSSKFVIPSKTVDLSTLSVSVYDSAGSSLYTKYTNVSDILKITGTSPVFFIKQRDDLFYEVYFGNNSIGKAVVNGNVVRLNYIISDGPVGNSASYFTYQSGYNSGAGFVITTSLAASGGSAEESLDSIRFNAPRSFISQNRAVTASDYENLISSSYSNVESVRCWGGQDNIPKAFGKVFVCAKPVGKNLFSRDEKAEIIQSLLSKRGMVTITPEFLDPEFLNIQITCGVNYNANQTAITPDTLVSRVRSVILGYGNTLNKFDSVFRFSKLSALIDATDDSITSNSSSIKIRFPVTVDFGTATQYKRTSSNPILSGTFLSTRFFTVGITDRCFIGDDGLGTIKLYSEDVLGTSYYVRDIGLIDYTLGQWDIPLLNVLSLHDPLLEFVFQPASNDVVSTRNMIIAISVETLVIGANVDLIAMGQTSGGNSYNFIPVRP